MEIHGYEKAITFGQSKEIYCITHLNVTQIEWFRVGADDRPLEKAYGNQQLTMTVDTKRARLNGAIFTCRVTDVEGNQYEESVSIRVKGEWYNINISPYGVLLLDVWKRRPQDFTYTCSTYSFT